jgi:hypothetical protein
VDTVKCLVLSKNNQRGNVIDLECIVTWTRDKGGGGPGSTLVAFQLITKG